MVWEGFGSCLPAQSNCAPPLTSLHNRPLSPEQVIAAAQRVLVASCHDCTLYLGAVRSPVLTGDNRFLRLAPFNTRYERQLAHLHDVGVRLDVPNKWDSPLVLQGEWSGAEVAAGKNRQDALCAEPCIHTPSFTRFVPAPGPPP